MCYERTAFAYIKFLHNIFLFFFSQSGQIRTIIKARGLWHPNLNGKTFAVFRVDNKHHLMSLVSMFGKAKGRQVLVVLFAAAFSYTSPPISYYNLAVSLVLD